MFGFFKKKKRLSQTKESSEIVISENFDDITNIVKYFQNETGVSFEKQTAILQNKVILFCRQRKITSFDKLLEMLQSNNEMKQDFIDYLTTNETYFYREFKQIEELVQLVKQENKKVDILCAPSATGEEPYSIAISLLEAGVFATQFHITGIDINKSAIKRAQKAIYGQRSIKYLSPSSVDKYFIKKKNNFMLKENIKSLVTFKIVNIFDPSIDRLGKFDFVFSRNMLIYFDKTTKQKAKHILENMRKNNKHHVFFGHADLF